MVTNIFSAAIDDLFTDPNLATQALYRAGAGPDVPVRVILRRPDRIGGDFGPPDADRSQIRTRH